MNYLKRTHWCAFRLAFDEMQCEDLSGLFEGDEAGDGHSAPCTIVN
jgi:hypothetical protein